MRAKILLTIALLALLCACGGGTDAAPASGVDAAQVARSVLDSQTDAGGLSEQSGEDLAFYLTGLYGLEEGSWSDAAVYAASGVDAREIAVLCPAAEDGLEGLCAALEAYRRTRAGDFFGYAPAQSALLENAAVVTGGGYAALLVCQDLQAAKDAFAACIEEAAVPVIAPADVPQEPAQSASEPETPREAENAPAPSAAASDAPQHAAGGTAPPSAPASPAQTAAPTATPVPVLNPDLDISGFVPFDPPNEHDMSLYDTAAIHAAWTGGDVSGLSEKDAAVLERCREIFASCITDGMTAFERELALHDYLVAWGEYDQTVYDARTPQGRADNTNPYGMLTGGYGICLGYATTFQLLMDLAEVECITVVGASSDSTGDHAWNMVRLEGEWYCVDPTWDDPSGDYTGVDPSWMTRMNHRYFNVTSDHMRRTNHQWDYRNVPEAVSIRFFWDGTGELPH